MHQLMVSRFDEIFTKINFSIVFSNLDESHFPDMISPSSAIKKQNEEEIRKNYGKSIPISKLQELNQVSDFQEYCRKESLHSV